jgi:hypothetical protein
MTLRCETNTAEVEYDVVLSFDLAVDGIHYPQADFEHGQWFITCLDCGGQWSAVDAGAGYDFERVTDGDGFCEEQA